MLLKSFHLFLTFKNDYSIKNLNYLLIEHYPPITYIHLLVSFRLEKIIFKLNEVYMFEHIFILWNYPFKPFKFFNYLRENLRIEYFVILIFRLKTMSISVFHKFHFQTLYVSKILVLCSHVLNVCWNVVINKLLNLNILRITRFV